jgi:acetate kinase
VILVLNSGSSSIKYKLFTLQGESIYGGLVEEVKDFHQAFDNIFENLISQKHISKVDDIQAFGHRVVHGGEKFTKSTLITDEVIDEIRALIPLAPLHNPSNLDGILMAKTKAPYAIQIAVFDTAFHQSMPKHSYIYPIPYELYENNGIRRYGFHGTSHQYITKECANYLQKPIEKLNAITIHLGNGDSITAIKNGKSIDTSMGFTPLEGLMMGTRSGDIDSEIIIYLEKELGLNPNEVDTLLNKQSGFKGITGKSDLREIKEDAKQGDTKALLAIDMFCYRVKKYIGSYKEVLGEIDAIVFTGGIGENAPFIREKISNSVDIIKNQNIYNISEIQKDTCDYKVLVIPTNEELEIARECLEFL